MQIKERDPWPVLSANGINNAERRAVALTAPLYPPDFARIELIVLACPPPSVSPLPEDPGTLWEKKSRQEESTIRSNGL